MKRKYTPLACVECKRRKVKCDGRRPCDRCSQHAVECVYIQRSNVCEDEHERQIKMMADQIKALQEQINQIVSQPKFSDSSQAPVIATPLSTSLPGVNEHDHGAIRQEIRTTCDTDAALQNTNFTFGLSESPFTRLGMQPRAQLPATDRSRRLENDGIDPLLSISQVTALRLLSVYHEDCGSMYPFVDKDILIKAVSRYYAAPPSERSPTSPRTLYRENTLSGGIFDVLKLVIAIAVVIENNGPTPLSTQLLDDVEFRWNGQLCGPRVDIQEIQAWTAMSILQFYYDEEALAWRTIGLAARAAIEVGLHNREVYIARFSTQEERTRANRLFWSIYVLDRRWSFGIGLPFAINDNDIDPELPEPSRDQDQILATMVTFGRIQCQVWSYGTKLTQDRNLDELAFVEFRIQRWQESLPDELKMPSDLAEIFRSSTYVTIKLRALLYLFANQMRLLLFRRNLLSPRTIAKDPLGAQKVVDIARDSIRMLDLLDRQSSIYASQQASFNGFLISALAVLFLAACHANAQFNESCREEFFMAMDLVRKFSSKSYIGMKLSKSLEHFKAIGLKLGLFHVPIHKRTQAQPGESDSTDIPNLRTSQSEVSSSNLPMHVFHGHSVLQDSPIDGMRLSKELTELFETLKPTYDSVQIFPDGDHWELNFDRYGTSEDLSRSLMHLF